MLRALFHTTRQKVGNGSALGSTGCLFKGQVPLVRIFIHDKKARVFVFRQKFGQTTESLYHFKDWCPKFATGLNTIIGCISKSIWVTKWLFCQNYLLIGESFWQNNNLVTHIFFLKYSLLWYLAQSQILGITLYFCPSL